MLGEVFCLFHGVALREGTASWNLAQHLPGMEDITYNLFDKKLLVLLNVFYLAVLSVVFIVHGCPWWVFACMDIRYAFYSDSAVNIVLVERDGVLTCSDNCKRPGYPEDLLAVRCSGLLSGLRR